jgi:hypothetical protein
MYFVALCAWMALQIVSPLPAASDEGPSEGAVDAG